MSEIQGFKVQEDVVSKLNDKKESIIMKLDESDSFFKLTGAMSWVWEMINQGHDSQTITTKAIEVYKVDEKTFENDLSKMIKTFKDKGFIN